MRRYIGCYAETLSRIEDIARAVNSKFIRLRDRIKEYQEEPFCTGMVYRLSRYPYECSREAAFMLTRILQQKEISNLSCVMQRYGKPASSDSFPPLCHTWVSWRNVSIDVVYGGIAPHFTEEILITEKHPFEECNVTPFPEWRRRGWVTGSELVTLEPEPDYYLDIMFELI